MIGGIDVRIPTRARDLSIEVSVRAIRQIWSHAVFENSLTGEHYEDFRDIPFGKVDELFVYRDRAAAQVWEEQGAVPDACNSMIHLIADSGMLTAVIDRRNHEMDTILEAIRSGLVDEILQIRALLGSAA